VAETIAKTRGRLVALSAILEEHFVGEVEGVHFDLRCPQVETGLWETFPLWHLPYLNIVIGSRGPPLRFPWTLGGIDGLHVGEEEQGVPVAVGSRIVVRDAGIHLEGDDWADPHDRETLQTWLRLEEPAGPHIDLETPLVWNRRERLHQGSGSGSFEKLRRRLPDPIPQITARDYAEGSRLETIGGTGALAAHRASAATSLAEALHQLERIQAHPQQAPSRLRLAADALVDFGYYAALIESDATMRPAAERGRKDHQDRRKGGVRLAQARREQLVQTERRALAIAVETRRIDPTMTQRRVAEAIKQELRSLVSKVGTLEGWVRRWERNGELPRRTLPDA
jgi:hypothetical protein